MQLVRRRMESISGENSGQMHELRPALDPCGVDSRDGDPAWVAAVRERLVAWYRDAGRDLPWRASRDAYRILVSEMMLVQTTVAAVIPFFERFVTRFPDAAALARADEAEVVKAWEGLGYYRRARQLHAAARTIVREHSGVMPTDPAAVRALPGVGRYIAGAILSFAMDLPEPIVEANSQRVLARLLAIRDDTKLASTNERLWQAASRLVPPENPGAFNQALMDLGALVCTPREPGCLICPLSPLCQARRLGLQDQLPISRPKAPPLPVTEAAVIVARAGRVLILQRAPGGLWERFWEFPTVHLEGVNPAGRPTGDPGDLRAPIKLMTAITARISPPTKTILYSVTKHRVKLIVHLATASSGDATPGLGFLSARWVEPKHLGEFVFSSPNRRLIAWIASSSEFHALERLDSDP
jgi:A/G-specific adenine glycosylase